MSVAGPLILESDSVLSGSAAASSTGASRSAATSAGTSLSEGASLFSHVSARLSSASPRMAIREVSFHRLLSNSRHLLC